MRNSRFKTHFYTNFYKTLFLNLFPLPSDHVHACNAPVYNFGPNNEYSMRREMKYAVPAGCYSQTMTKQRLLNLLLRALE